MASCEKQRACTLVFAVIFSMTASAADSAAIVSQAIASIVETRELTSAYVLEVKRRFKPGQADYEHPRDLYVVAFSKHSAWIAVMTSAIRRGKTKSLEKDPTYQALSAQADASVKAFTSYIQSLKTIPKSRAAPVAALAAGLGLNVWNGIKDRKQKERDEQADRFERDTKWLPWEAIQAGG